MAIGSVMRSANRTQNVEPGLIFETRISQPGMLPMITLSEGICAPFLNASQRFGKK